MKILSIEGNWQCRGLFQKLDWTRSKQGLDGFKTAGNVQMYIIIIQQKNYSNFMYNSDCDICFYFISNEFW